MNVFATDPFWRFALMAIPLALLVALLCRCLPIRPATRHTLWLTLLVMFLVAPLLPQAPVPDLASIAMNTSGDRAPAAHTPDASDHDRSTNDDRDDAGLLPATRYGPEAAREDRAGPATVGASPVETRETAAARVDGDEIPFDAINATLLFPFQRPLPSTPPKNSESGVKRSGTTIRPGTPRSYSPSSSSTNESRGVIQRSENGSDHAFAATSPASPAGAPSESSRRATQPQRPTAAQLEGGSSIWTNWLTALRTVRDTVMSLPPIPTAVWGGGALLLLLIMLVRAACFRRLVRIASPGDPEALIYVNEAADNLGLRRRPEVMMVDAHISPMVSCGRCVRLLLPRRLWSQLDAVGRRAVIYHELAHLRRRDHWVCWLALVAGCIYWWHPVVWWVRRQLREEADLCCDVWVTTLLPASRRAYATALLETKRFTSAPQPAEPLVALGVMRTNAKRFARRLKMVMSHQLMPKMTFGGAALACLLAAGTWLSTPTLACPPEKNDATCDKESKNPVVRVVAAPDPCEKTDKASKSKTSKQTAVINDLVQSFTRAAQDKDLSIEQRVRRIEDKLAHLMAIVGDLEQLQGQLTISAPALQSLQHKLGDLPAVPTDVLTAIEPALAQAGDAAEKYKSALEAYNVALGTRGGAAGLAQLVPTQNQNPMIVRKYELPEGKLAAITELMVRADVPVLVRPGDDAIEVHGTADQHRIFKAFCTMINGEDRRVDYKLPKGKLDALTKLMIRSDVPIFVSPGDDHIEVQGTDLEQAVFGAFVKMISGETVAPPAGAADAATVAPERRRLRVDAPPIQGSVREKARVYEAQARARIARMNAVRNNIRNLERQLDRIARQREELERRAETIEDKADAIEEKARDLEEKAEDLEGQQRVQAIRRLNELILQAAQLENEARLNEAQADAMEAQADALEDQIDDLEDQLQDLEDEHEDAERESSKDDDRER
jgi:beta-lactamase regulating signal transducer with metallopeptidase domain